MRAYPRSYTRGVTPALFVALLTSWQPVLANKTEPADPPAIFSGKQQTGATAELPKDEKGERPAVDRSEHRRAIDRDVLL